MRQVKRQNARCGEHVPCLSRRGLAAGTEDTSFPGSFSEVLMVKAHVRNDRVSCCKLVSVEAGQVKGKDGGTVNVTDVSHE